MAFAQHEQTVAEFETLLHSLMAYLMNAARTSPVKPMRF